jgi:hypothetical protein
VSGLGLLVASFLPWYSAGGEDATAWEAFSVVDLVIPAAAFAGLSVGAVVLFRLSVSYPVAGCAIATGLGTLALVLIAYRLVDPPGKDLGLEVGAWVGLVASAGITLGCYLGMQEPTHARADSLG